MSDAQPSTSRDDSSNEMIGDENANSVKKALFEKELDDAQQKRLDFLVQKVELFAHFVEGSPKQNAATRHKGRGKSKKPLRKSFQANDENDSQSKQQPAGIRFEQTPSYIEGEMRDYQLRGLNWLISLYENGINGILADEMGLGKTLQTISMLGFLKFHENFDGPFLVIGPKSTLQNWINEINRFCPTLRALKLIGDKNARSETLLEMHDDEWDVCVTTYNMILLENGRLNRFQWRYIVCDEAHRMKNEKNQFSQIMRRFHSTNRLLLTGTPLQNNLHELWALLNYLLPDVFASSDDFDTWFDSDDCLRGNDAIVKRLQAILKPFMLRRVKSEVEKSLLPKIELKLFVGLTELQRETYIKVLRKEVVKINSFGEETPKKLDMIVQELRKAANHPYLIDGIEPGPPYTTDEHLVNCCGKMMLLDKLLAKLKAQGSRVLLFSQFVIMLDILDDYLNWRGYQYRRLDGQTPYEQRAQEIDEFNAENSEIFVYMISTRAGGLGINLATADTVIIYDSDWNPQSDLQAIDRAHRIGQKKQVRIFRLVTENTVDERIVQRAEIKLRLDNIIIQQGRNIDKQTKESSKGVKNDILRFGLDSILSSNGPGVTDIDIDEMLKYGEKKTADENDKLAKLGESQLRNMTLEEASSVSVYQFNGIDYRSQRKVQNDHNQREFRERYPVQYIHQAPNPVPKDRKIFLHTFQFFPSELIELCEPNTRHLNMSIHTDIKERLLNQGFKNWTRIDYKAFCDALLEFGRNKYEDIAQKLPNKTLEEVTRYHNMFFIRGSEESLNIRRIINQIAAKELKSSELQNQTEALVWKMSQYTMPEWQLEIRGRKENPLYPLSTDRYLLIAFFKYRLDGDDVYGRIQNDVRSHPTFLFDWFMRGRTVAEIKQRIQQLLLLIVREYLAEKEKIEENQTIPSSTGAINKRKLK